MLNSGGVVIGSYLGGKAYDHYNPYVSLLAGIAVSCLTLLAMVLHHGWPAFALELLFLGLGSGWNSTLISAFGTSIHRYDGRYVFNMLYFVQNLGIVIGTAMVGFVYSISITLLFTITLVFYAFFGVVALIYYRPIQQRRLATPELAQISASKTVLPRPNRQLLIILMAALMLVWLMYQQWMSNLSVYMTSLHIPLRDYSFLWTLNATLIVLIQALINRLGQRIKGPFTQIIFGIFFVALSFVVLIFAKDYAHFTLAMIVLTIGEATAFPAIPALINSLSPSEAKGKYQGLANAWGAIGRAIGPLFGGVVIELSSYSSLFTLAALAVLGVWLSLVLGNHFLSPTLTYYDRQGTGK